MIEAEASNLLSRWRHGDWGEDIQRIALLLAQKATV